MTRATDVPLLVTGVIFSTRPLLPKWRSILLNEGEMGKEEGEERREEEEKKRAKVQIVEGYSNSYI